MDENPIYQQEVERTEDYYEEPSPQEPENPVYTPVEGAESGGEPPEEDESYEYYVPEDLDADSEDNIAVYESDDDVELTPMYAEDLENEEAEESEESVESPQEEGDTPSAEDIGEAPSEEETDQPEDVEVEELEVVELQPLPDDDETPLSPPTPREESSTPLVSTVPIEEEPTDQEAEPQESTDDDEDDFVVSTPYKPVIVFDDEEPDGSSGPLLGGVGDEEEESDEEFEAVFFDDSEDEEDFEIVTSKEIDPKKASNIALIRSILSKINNLKHIGKDVSMLEEKMVLVFNCKDEDRKLVLARSCLEAVDKLDKETDEEIFEETAQRYHALRARLLVLAKKGRNVNIHSSMVEEASQAISKGEFSEAESIIDKVMAELDKML
jgi:hypothetical protein